MFTKDFNSKTIFLSTLFRLDRTKNRSNIRKSLKSSFAYIFDDFGDESAVELIERVDGENVGRVSAGDQRQFVDVDVFADADGNQLHAQTLQVGDGGRNRLPIVTRPVRDDEEILGHVFSLSALRLEDVVGLLERFSGQSEALQKLDGGDFVSQRRQIHFDGGGEIQLHSELVRELGEFQSGFFGPDVQLVDDFGNES